MAEQEFAAGHVFFRPGDPGDRAYLLHDGQVEVVAGAEGAFSRVRLFGPGDVFGEMALIEERPRTLTARAVTAVRATPLTRDEFEHQLIHDPARARQYLRSLFERLRSLAARVGGVPEPVHGAPPPLPHPAAEPARPGPLELTPARGKPSAWAVVLHPLTRKAAQTLPDEGLLITRFPLRIGRAAGAHERDALDLNDLWLLDEKPFHVSRNHCEIQVDGQGPGVCDRGSHLGCIVNDVPIGGRAITDFARLEPGENVLVIGGRMSAYQFRVTVSRTDSTT
jgi:hypothetical protein